MVEKAEKKDFSCPRPKAKRRVLPVGTVKVFRPVRRNKRRVTPRAVASLATYAACDFSRAEVVCEVLKVLGWSEAMAEVLNVAEVIEERLGDLLADQGKVGTTIDDALLLLKNVMLTITQNAVIKWLLRRLVLFNLLVEGLKVGVEGLELLRFVLAVYKEHREVLQAAACRGGSI